MKFALSLTFMADERKSGDAPGLAVRVGDTVQSLGLVRWFGDVELTKWNRVRPSRSAVLLAMMRGSSQHPTGFE